VIAELSTVMQPFTDALLREVVSERRPGSVLDVGCGSGRQLATMLEAARGASGTGIELDPAASELARAHLAERGLADRAEVLTGDARELVADLPEPVDLALLANVVYYVPVDERVDLFGSLLGALRPGGVLVVVSTALLDDPFSRHFDLLLRAQEGRMELPDFGQLTAQLADAGFVPAAPRRIAYGEPLHAVVATRP
jgi:SAM-dependent methyltransferase